MFNELVSSFGEAGAVLPARSADPGVELVVVPVRWANVVATKKRVTQTILTDAFIRQSFSNLRGEFQ
jgi:hypothetical protein